MISRKTMFVNLGPDHRSVKCVTVNCHVSVSWVFTVWDFPFCRKAVECILANHSWMP